MIKILFLIHDLGQGGAEKVLVNLVNNMDRAKFDISVTVLFGGGVNEQFLKPDIKYNAVWPREIPGNSRLMKILSPEKLHKICVKDTYDIEVSYLEGPSARVISGCRNPNTKLVSWIHIEQKTKECFAQAFRSYDEAAKCYARFDRLIAVSKTVAEDFAELAKPQRSIKVLYNTNETQQILRQCAEDVDEGVFNNDEIKLIGVGSLEKHKGFDRMISITNKLVSEGYAIHLYILGKGSQRSALEDMVKEKQIEEHVTFLGYQTNPYKYISKCDLFVCASLLEGFSTAATEALILGVAVCTVEVSGMKEMLGENNKFGIVTENNEKALHQGIKNLLDDPKLLSRYKEKAAERGKVFSTEKTVRAAERMFEELQ